MNTLTTRYAVYAPSSWVSAGSNSYYWIGGDRGFGRQMCIKLANDLEFAQHGFSCEAEAIEFVTQSGWALDQVVIKPYDATDEIEMEAFYNAQ